MSVETHPDLHVEHLPSYGGNSSIVLDDRQAVNAALDDLLDIGSGGIKIDCTIMGSDFDVAEPDSWQERFYPRYQLACGREAVFSLAAGMMLNPDFPLDGPTQDFREAGKNLLALAHDLSHNQAVVFGNRRFYADPTDGYGITLMAGSEQGPSVAGLVIDKTDLNVKILKLNEDILLDVSNGAYEDSLVGWLGIEQNGLITIAGPNAIMDVEPERYPQIAITSREFVAPIRRDNSKVISALRSAIRAVRGENTYPDTQYTDDMQPELPLETSDSVTPVNIDTQGIMGAFIRGMQSDYRTRGEIR